MSTTTGFFRNAAQLELLARLRPGATSAYVFGCSGGCEPYSLLFSFALANPATELRVRGFDIDTSRLRQATAAVYDVSEVNYYKTDGLSSNWVERFLMPVGPDCYEVNADMRRRCQFAFGSVLDDSWMCALPTADIVMCQNVLIHMSRRDNTRALRNLVRLMDDDSLLVIGGVRPDWRSKLTQELALVPVVRQTKRIHDGWQELRSSWEASRSWLRHYYALEPFREVADWPRRFGTIFRKPSSVRSRHE